MSGKAIKSEQVGIYADTKGGKETGDAQNFFASSRTITTHLLHPFYSSLHFNGTSP